MIKKWMAKALIQKTISILPFSFEINYFFQKNLTKAVRINKTFFLELINEGNKLLKECKEDNKELDQLTFLELGTGWHPILPVYFYLCGAKKICTIDLNNHLRKENLFDLFNLFIEQYETKRDYSFIQEERILSLKKINDENENLSIEKILSSLNIETKIGDFTQIQLKEKYDICFSVNVLEHINEKILDPILQSFYDNSSKKSIHFHSFGSYDHFCHVDKSISKFNFLKYSKSIWKLIDNNIQPQNRWRVSDFEKLFINKGFKVKTSLHSKPNLKELNKIKLHQDFKNIPKEICAIDYGVFVLEK